MFRPRLGVRARILAIALVPSLTLFAVGAGVAGYLLNEGNKAQEWSVQNRNAIPSTRGFVEALQQERQSTLGALSGDQSAKFALGRTRLQLDNAIDDLVVGASGVRAANNPDMGDIATKFASLPAILTQVRTAADTGRLPLPDAYAFYNRLLDAVAAGSRITAVTAPNAAIASRLTDAIRLFRIDEARSRADVVADVIIGSNGPAPIPMTEFLYQIGLYRSEAARLVDVLDSEQRKTLRTLMSSQAWQQLESLEDALAQRNTTTSSNGSSNISTTNRQSAAPAVSTQDWHSAAAEVNSVLIDLWLDQNEHAQKLAEDEAVAIANASTVGGSVVILISLLGFVISVLLANRFSRRLERLRSQTLALADERLPELMRRLGDGEMIDPATESPDLHYGHDEIGQVATAFQHANNAAIAGAVNEARAREGLKTFSRNIAHRNQLVVHRQLEILDEAERSQEDPALLELLFTLDHLATRERRNAENLVVLGGGESARRWRNPVSLTDVVRSAVCETLDYTHVRVARLPDTHVHGGLVADLTHLLAELLDNATSFSPPRSRVEVTGSMVGNGVVTEISDQGIGMLPAEIDRVNEILRKPKDFSVAALADDSRLGLFVVAQLAGRHGVSVRLTESDYGGIRAIVLIPAAFLAWETSTQTTYSEPITMDRHILGRSPSADLSAIGAETARTTTPLPRMSAAESPTSAQLELDALRAQLELDALEPTSPDSTAALPRGLRQTDKASRSNQPVPTAEQTAEEARARMAAIQDGARRARHARPDDHPVVAPDER